MVLNHDNSPAQEDIYRSMLLKPVADEAGFARVWSQQVLPLKDAYPQKS